MAAGTRLSGRQACGSLIVSVLSVGRAYRRAAWGGVDLGEQLAGEVAHG
jgi:hypothetical protein